MKTVFLLLKEQFLQILSICGQREVNALNSGAQIWWGSVKPNSFIIYIFNCNYWLNEFTQLYLQKYHDMVVNKHSDQDDAQKIPRSDSLIGMKKTETFTQEICKM